MAVWKIEEEESFFLRSVPLQRDITHPHKRLQHLAGRYLLRFLFPDFPIELIKIADTRKPFLEDEAFHFSISHCADYAAVIVSTANRVGIDIELPTPKIEKIKNRFAGEAELAALAQKSFVTIAVGESEESNLSLEHLTLLWCCKEAVFKWFGEGGVDFREDMQLEKLNQIAAADYTTTIWFKKNNPVLLSLRCHFFDGPVLCYVIT